MTVDWDNSYKIDAIVPRYPSELVVRWLFSTFSAERRKTGKVLDLGGGGGRHSIVMAEAGLEVVLADTSPSGIAHGEKLAREKQVSVTGVQCSADDLPFDDDSFDGVLCFGVLYYLDPETYARSLREIYRVLKPGGDAFVYVKTPDDSRGKMANLVGENRYQLASEDGNSLWPGEEGIVLTLLGEKELRDILPDFTNVRIDRSSVTRGGGRYVEDEWLIYLQK